MIIRIQRLNANNLKWDRENVAYALPETCLTPAAHEFTHNCQIKPEFQYN